MRILKHVFCNCSIPILADPKFGHQKGPCKGEPEWRCPEPQGTKKNQVPAKVAILCCGAIDVCYSRKSSSLPRLLSKKRFGCAVRGVGLDDQTFHEVGVAETHVPHVRAMIAATLMFATFDSLTPLLGSERMVSDYIEKALETGSNHYETSVSTTRGAILLSEEGNPIQIPRFGNYFWIWKSPEESAEDCFWIWIRKSV